MNYCFHQQKVYFSKIQGGIFENPPWIFEKSKNPGGILKIPPGFFRFPKNPGGGFLNFKNPGVAFWILKEFVKRFFKIQLVWFLKNPGVDFSMPKNPGVDFWSLRNLWIKKYTKIFEIEKSTPGFRKSTPGFLKNLKNPPLDFKKSTPGFPKSTPGFSKIRPLDF